MRRETRNKIIELSITLLIVILIVGSLFWAESGYAPCSWYNFNANTTIAREVMTTCLK